MRLRNNFLLYAFVLCIFTAHSIFYSVLRAQTAKDVEEIRPILKIISAIKSRGNKNTYSPAYHIVMLIQQFDLLFRTTEPWVVSPCSTFSYLFAELYELHDKNIQATLRDAIFLLGDTYEILRNFTDGLPYMMGPLNDEREQIEDFFVRTLMHFSEKKRTENAIRRLGFENSFRAMNGSDSRLTQFRLNSLKKYFLYDFRKYTWLSNHSGLAALTTPRGLEIYPNQGRSAGYIQLSGDRDSTGRHDHLMANFLIGYTLKKVNNHRSFWGRWAGIRTLLSNSLSESVGQAAESADLFLGRQPSSTDMRVNFLGQELGSLMALQKKMNTEDLESEIYGRVCDESSINPKIHGPLGKILKFPRPLR